MTLVFFSTIPKAVQKACSSRQQSGRTTSSRYTALRLSMLTLLALSAAGCRQDMHDQPKFYPQRSTNFFADGRSSRPQVDGTVARSQGNRSSYFETGLISGSEGNTLPFAPTMAVLQRGQERYNVYCTPCHSRVGNGKGMIVERGYYPATNANSERLRYAPLGHFFQVITNGYGAMPNYAAELTPQDRWAVVAYMRALQLSQHATEADLPSGVRPEPLEEIAERVGLNREFLDPWLGKPTAPRPLPPSAAKPPAKEAVPAVTALPTAARGSSEKSKAPVEPAKSGKTAVLIADGSAVGTKPAAAKPTAPALPKEDAAAGKTLYEKNCSMCHQVTRAGLPPMIPSLIGIVSRTSAEHVRTMVTNGAPDAKPPMPAFTKLSSTDIGNIIEYLKTAK